MTAFARLVVCALAQRNRRSTAVCACGAVIYGALGRDGETCALCALRAEAVATFDPLAVCFTAKYSSVERST